MLALLLSILLFPQESRGYKFWENFSIYEKRLVLKNPDVPLEVLNLLNAESDFPIDNESTTQVLEILSSNPKNKGIRALYFYLFNRWFYRSDGELGELVSPYCLRMIMNHLDFILSYFSIQPGIMEWYANHIGYELGMDDCYIEAFNRFKQKLGAVKISDNNIATRKKFFELVDYSIKSVI